MKLLGHLQPVESAEEPHVNVVATPVAWPGDGLAKSNISAARHEHDLGDNIAREQHAAVDAAAQKRADNARRLNNLQHQVDVATERLAVADQRKAWLVRRAADLRAQVPSLWSMEVPDIALGIQSPPAEVSLIEIHQTIRGCDDAIASLGPVREKLVANLNGHKLILSQFQRDNQP